MPRLRWICLNVLMCLTSNLGVGEEHALNCPNRISLSQSDPSDCFQNIDNVSFVLKVVVS